MPRCKLSFGKSRLRGPPKSLVGNAYMRSLPPYAEGTRGEDNAADGLFSTACQTPALLSFGNRISLWPHSLQYFEWMLFSAWQRLQIPILCNQMVLIKWKTIEVINAEKVHTATNIQVSSEVINFLIKKDTT